MPLLGGCGIAHVSRVAAFLTRRMSCTCALLRFSLVAGRCSTLSHYLWTRCDEAVSPGLIDHQRPSGCSLLITQRAPFCASASLLIHLPPPPISPSLLLSPSPCLPASKDMWFKTSIASIVLILTPFTAYTIWKELNHHHAEPSPAYPHMRIAHKRWCVTEAQGSHAAVHTTCHGWCTLAMC